jgi:hypothetical protein
MYQTETKEVMIKRNPSDICPDEIPINRDAATISCLAYP